MNKRIYLLTLIAILPYFAFAQLRVGEPVKHKNFPLMIGAEFISVAWPLRDVGTSFSNPGIRLGTEISFSRSGNWGQTLSIGMSNNRSMGTAAGINTQTYFRPNLKGSFFLELRAGLGLMNVRSHTDSYKQSDGQWHNMGSATKVLGNIPLAAGIAYYHFREGFFLEPFASYEFSALINYNETLPLLPSGSMQFGARVHF